MSKTEHASRTAICSIDSPVRMAECRDPETYSLALHTRNSHDALNRIHSPVKLSATDQASAASLQLLILSHILRLRVGAALLSKIGNIGRYFEVAIPFQPFVCKVLECLCKNDSVNGCVMFPPGNVIDFSPVHLMPLAILSQANHGSDLQAAIMMASKSFLPFASFGLNTMLLGAMPNNGWLEAMLSRVSFLRH